MHPLPVARQEGHAPGKPLHQVSSLGIEGHVEPFRMQGVLLAGVGQPVAVVPFVYARLVTPFGLWPLEHGEHARETGLASPVGHVAREGPHLVESRAVERIKGQVASRLPLSVNFQFAPLHHLPARVDQLHVEHTAQGGGPAVVRPHHVSLEPYLLAHVIPRVVEVQIDLLLEHVARGMYCVGHAGEQAVQRRFLVVFLRGSGLPVTECGEQQDDCNGEADDVHGR